MRDYHDEIARFEEDAEDRYDDFDRDDYEYEDEFQAGLEGLEDDYDDEYEEVEFIPVAEDEEYYNYNANSIGRIDPNDRTLTVVVKSTATEEQEVVIFGANEAKAPPAGVTIDVAESSHQEVREESKSNPFTISGMKMSVSDPLQFDNVLQIYHRSSTGKFGGGVYQPRNATSPQNQDKGLIDDDNFEMDVTGKDSLRFKVKPGITVVFTFTIKARANMGNVLAGKNVAEMSTTPRTTGLPQLDLIRNKKSQPLGLPPKSKKVVKRVVRKRPKRTSLRPKRPGVPKRRFLRRR